MSEVQNRKLSLNEGVQTWLRHRWGAIQGNLRTGKATRESRLKIVDRLSLGGKQSLAVVSFDGSRYLVAIGAEGAPGLMRVQPAPASEGAFGYARLHAKRVPSALASKGMP